MRFLITLLGLWLAALSNVYAAGAMLRISCADKDVGAEVLVNGKFRGECPVDIKLPAGPVKLRVHKKISQFSERFLEQEFQLADDSAKKVEVELVATQFTDEGKRLEESLRKKAEAGDAAAMGKLGEHYGNAKRSKEAIRWYTAGAAAGDSVAMANLGEYNLFGIGMAKNISEAALWIRKAAEAGNHNGAFALGDLYETGEGMPKNQALADDWYRKAAETRRKLAEAGDAEAMYGLGSQLSYGHGVSLSKTDACAWFEKAAEKDHLQGMLNTAECYSLGTGVQKDQARAASWWRRAAKKGSDRAAAQLKKNGLS